MSAPAVVSAHRSATPISGRRLKQLLLERTGDARLAREVEVVSQVLPFKVNTHVLDDLIDWTKAPDDPLYRLVFPHRDMLRPDIFDAIERSLDAGDRAATRRVVAETRAALNPHPGDQLQRNVPREPGIEAWGLQHKYRKTLLVFPKQGQTCHSYCAYCFRWAQFVDQPEYRLALSGPQVMTEYLDRHPEVSDVLLTGDDPLIMRTELLEQYLLPLLDPAFEHVRTVRLGTKAVSFWPYRLTETEDADRLLRLLTRLVDQGKHVAMMLHVSHPRELVSRV